MTPEDVIERLGEVGVIAVIRAADLLGAVRAVNALVAGGVRGIEITFTTPDAELAIKEIAAIPDIVLGAGTLRTSRQVADAVSAGASFLVAPGVEPDVARAMVDTEKAVLLGALTPTEVMVALGEGAHAVKLFPGSLGGPAYLRTLSGPFPELRIMPTGGVSVDNVGEWFAAGAFAVGAGSELCSAADIAAQRWGRIEENARRFVEACRDSRLSSSSAH